MSTELKRLTSAGRSLIGEDFFEGRREFSETDLGPYLESVGINLDLSPIEERFQEAKDGGEFETQRHLLDAEMAPVVHDTIDVSRRTAADAGLWHFLTVVHFPEFVRYRWEGSTTLDEKFLRAGTDIYSNALHRLWWMAELTYEDDQPVDDGRYERTERVLSFQELANDIFDRWFARYRPVAVACADLLDKSILDEEEPSSSKVASQTTTRLREDLTVLRVEAMTDEEIEEKIISLRDEVIQELS
jgi:hypothetical protein